jgi:hypothetical protein
MKTSFTDTPYVKNFLPQVNLGPRLFEKQEGFLTNATPKCRNTVNIFEERRLTADP